MLVLGFYIQDRIDVKLIYQCKIENFSSENDEWIGTGLTVVAKSFIFYVDIIDIFPH